MAHWSQLRKIIRERWAVPLQKRLDLHYTVYQARGTGKVRNYRFWITLDGSEIFSADSFGEKNNGELGLAPRTNADDTLQAVRESLDLSIETALQHSNAVVRAFAVADARTGRRTLEKLALREDESPLVRSVLKLRGEEREEKG